jgi:hypothetical protein
LRASGFRGGLQDPLSLAACAIVICAEREPALTLATVSVRVFSPILRDRRCSPTSSRKRLTVSCGSLSPIIGRAGGARAKRIVTALTHDLRSRVGRNASVSG